MIRRQEWLPLLAVPLGVRAVARLGLVRHDGQHLGRGPLDQVGRMGVADVRSFPTSGPDQMEAAIGPADRARIAHQPLTADLSVEHRFAPVDRMPRQAVSADQQVQTVLTIADLKVFVVVRGLASGQLEYIPIKLIETVAPKLKTHMQRIGNIPAIAQYYSKLGVA